MGLQVVNQNQFSRGVETDDVYSSCTIIEILVRLSNIEHFV
jgi:hypothetical protein